MDLELNEVPQHEEDSRDDVLYIPERSLIELAKAVLEYNEAKEKLKRELMNLSESLESDIQII